MAKCYIVRKDAMSNGIGSVWQGGNCLILDVISSFGDFSAFMSTRHAEYCQNARSPILAFLIFH